MNPTALSSELRKNLELIISMDRNAQKETIERIYDTGAHLESPYMVLNGRDEIIKSYATLSSNNMDLKVDIGSITFDSTTQTCMAEIKQTIRPKALGGVMSVNMHFFLKLQVEKRDEDGMYLIVDHCEIHVAQDLISQMPIVGSWYDSTIRNAVGQASMAGTSLLEYTGFLDFAPKAVDGVKGGASAVKQTVGSISSRIAGLGSSALRATGVTSLVGTTLGYARWGASKLYEEGKNEKIDCYSVSCQPGILCYSPTCPRNSSYSFLSGEAVHDIICGVYSGTHKTFFQYSGPPEI